MGQRTEAWQSADRPTVLSDRVGAEAARLYRTDLHCHSRASSGSAIAALGFLGVPECYSLPEQVYEQARRRGMDLVCLTDHDTIAGAMSLVERGFEGVIVGQEVTVHFPEDRCRLHVLVWGLTPELDAEIGRLRLRDDVYQFAHWLHERQLPNALAHPLYVQNGRLSAWHIERCLLLLRGFETLNGAHAGHLSDAIVRYLDSIGPAQVQALSNRHGILPVWPQAWEKARTGGSDDHGLLNVGKSWTEVHLGPHPPADRAHEFMRAVLDGRCASRGQAGDSSLLAHQLATVAAHYSADRLVPTAGARGRYIASRLLRFAGVTVPKPSKASLVLHKVRSRVALLAGKRPSPLEPLVDALRASMPTLLEKYPDLRHRLEPATWPDGAALSQHARMAAFADDLVETLSRGLASDAVRAWRHKDRTGAVDRTLSAMTAQLAQLPYLFSLFYQNKERRFVERFERESSLLAGSVRERAGAAEGAGSGRPIRVCLFTDTLGDVNGVCRFIGNLAEHAGRSAMDLRVITSTQREVPGHACVSNVEPIASFPLPRYEHLSVVLPPISRMLRLVDELQPDAVHVSTPGPVGMVGLLAARMMRVPALATYHTDFPAYAESLFDDPSMRWMVERVMQWFYRPFERVFTRSRSYVDSIQRLGVPTDRISTISPGVDVELFHPRYRHCSGASSVWRTVAPGAAEGSIKVLSVCRVSVEKNMPLLERCWRRVRQELASGGRPAELIVVGDGPYREQMERSLAGTGAHFVGFRHGEELSTIYASSDLFVFPSVTDTLGQVVMEAQASGLPALVTDQGGPKELVDDRRTGAVLPSEDERAWTEAILALVRDDARRAEVSAAARRWMEERSIARSLDAFWREHEAVVREHEQRGPWRRAARSRAADGGAASVNVAGPGRGSGADAQSRADEPEASAR